MFIWVPIHSLSATRTTNLHQLYSLLHVHLSPHPLLICYKNNKPLSILFNVACSVESNPLAFFPASRTTNIHQLYSLWRDHLSPNPLASYYKYTKHPSTLFNVACSFESQPYLLQEQHNSTNSIYCSMFIWVPIPSIPATSTRNPHQPYSLLHVNLIPIPPLRFLLQ